MTTDKHSKLSYVKCECLPTSFHSTSVTQPYPLVFFLYISSYFSYHYVITHNEVTSITSQLFSFFVIEWEDLSFVSDCLCICVSV